MIERTIGKESMEFSDKSKKTLWTEADCFSLSFSNRIRNKKDSLTIMRSKKGKSQSMSISITTRMFSIMKVTGIGNIRTWKIAKPLELENSKGLNYKKNVNSNKTWSKLRPNKDLNTREIWNISDLSNNSRKCVINKNISSTWKSSLRKRNRWIAESPSPHSITADITRLQIQSNITLTIHTF